MKSSLIHLARRIATHAHAGQFRRDGVTPYIEHPKAVSKRLENEIPEVIAVAWLHDVLEDGKITAHELGMADVPSCVIISVMFLTHKHGQTYSDYITAVKSNGMARKVKISDILCNLADDPTDKQILKYSRALIQLLDF